MAPDFDLRPMKAVSGPLPHDSARWAFEIKWDGMRVLSCVASDATVGLRSANGLDATGRYPELASLVDGVAGHPAVLDGEIVAFDETGKPSFGHLQQRMHVASPAEVARRAAAVPIAYIVFDLLRLEGNDVYPLPYLERRRLLAELLPEGGCWQVPAHRVGDGGALLTAVRAQGLEGIMAKELDSPYLPGRRSPSWRKVKARSRQEFVIGGWQPGEGGRSGRVGSLLIGVREAGRLRYCGKVGTGFTMRELARLDQLFVQRASDVCPFEPPPPRGVSRLARWMQPKLVAEIEFGEWTSDGVLRHPSYLGLRDDKAPADVVREGGPNGG